MPPDAAAPVSTSLLIPIRGPRLVQRFIVLIVGLVLFGLGIGLMLRSNLGLPPWDVLHQGLVKHFGLTIGTWSIITSVVVLVAWLPLREPYGIGTLLNAVIIGLSIDLSILVIPEPAAMAWRVVLLATGILVIGFASGLYIGVHLGPGPRDGLMTGLVVLAAVGILGHAQHVEAAGGLQGFDIVHWCVPFGHGRTGLGESDATVKPV